MQHAGLPNLRHMPYHHCEGQWWYSWKDASLLV